MVLASYERVDLTSPQKPRCVAYGVWFSFRRMDEKMPYVIERVRGLVCESWFHSDREKAADNFRRMVEADLKSV